MKALIFRNHAKILISFRIFELHFYNSLLMNVSTPKILLTGATGMLGAHLLWHLLQKGLTVRATKRERSNLTQTERIFSAYNDSLANYSDQLQWVSGDVLDYDSIEKAMLGIEQVYHCAAIVSFSKKPRRVLDINIRGTQNIVYAALKHSVKKFCFVSSIATLGKETGQQLITEKSPWDKERERSVYAQSKYLSEEVVWQAIKKGLPTIIVNPGVILGMADETNNSMQLFSSVMKGLPIYTKGGSGFVCVKDVCRAMINLMESEIVNERFVLVGENLSNKDLLFLIAKYLKKMPPFINGTIFLLYPIALVMEFFAAVFNTKAFIDRATVRVVLSRSFYSSQKIEKAIGFTFTAIENCVSDLCALLKRKR